VRVRPLAAVVVLVAATAAAGTAAAAPPPAAAAGPAAEPGERHTVTLITGDVVTVSTAPGRMPDVKIQPAAGRERIGFQQRRTRTSVRVVPSDAGPLISSGRLDARLFDVTSLIEQEYDDAHREDLPLIVKAGKSFQPSRAVRVTRALPSVQAQAVRATKGTAFWTQVKSGAAARVWLDGRVRASLDQSVPQIGAPQAWQSGFTGEGVKVAVLDTGVDSGHPDLADAVLEAQDFTGSPSGTADKVGHGTHVASIVTGAGDPYQGVAPDAELLAGKVLDDEGGGFDSWIIAGMEWATAGGAKVVNLSLGGFDEPGVDPVEQAVNELTEQTGALFVIAAGNEPYCGGTVSTPATADAALAVGAVDKQDAFAGFSCQGPRLGDHAIKPDLTAPGVDIVAARAGGTSLGDVVDDHYTRVSGTSMATPHVAGSAALLLQQHPDWTAAQLKPALMSSATPNAELSPFQQGTGRVDVARAVTTTVYPDQGSLSLFNRWPYQASLSRNVSYRNEGDQPVTLDLAASLPNASAEPARLTVPAHGSATATLVVDGTRAEPGDATGTLTAALADGSVVARTALGMYTEPESYDVTATVLDRDGKDISDNTMPVQLMNLDTFDFIDAELTDGRLVARVPKGRYELVTVIETADADGTVKNATWMTIPDLVVDQDHTLTLDARTARQVTARAGSPSAKPAGAGVNIIEPFYEGEIAQGWSNYYGDGQEVPLYASPTKPVTTRAFEFDFHTSLIEPLTSKGSRPPATYHLAFREIGRIPERLAFRADPDDLAVVDTHLHAQGAPTGAQRWDVPWLERGEYDVPMVDVYQEATMPERRIEYYTAAPDIGWELQVNIAGADGLGVTYEVPELPAGGVYLPGRTYRLDVNAAAIGTRMLYSNRDGESMNLGPEPMAPASSLQSGVFDAEGYSGQVTLARNGTVIGTTDDVLFPDLTMPPGPATYTVRQVVDRTVPWSKLGTHSDTSWTFRAQGPEPAGEAGPMGGPSEYFTTMATRVTGAFDDLNRAPGGRSFALHGSVWWNLEEGATPPRVEQLTMAASYDDGKTWHALPVTHDGDTWQAVAKHPVKGVGTGFVSLRTTILDNQDNKLEQTTLRAYQLK
jgi:subtilisin family serine protease